MTIKDFSPSNICMLHSAAHDFDPLAANSYETLTNYNMQTELRMKVILLVNLFMLITVGILIFACICIIFWPFDIYEK